VRAGLVAPVDGERLRRAATSSDERERQLACRLGVAAAIFAPRDFLADPSSVVRREALRLAAAAAQPLADDVWDLVVQALASDDPLEAEAACFYVGETADERARGALSTVVQQHPDLRCREAAVVALAQLGGDDARDLVIGALSDKPSVRRRAVVALSVFDGPEVDAAVERARHDVDWQTRSSAELLARED
jgi:HEAT repeat protein